MKEPFIPARHPMRSSLASRSHLLPGSRFYHAGGKLTIVVQMAVIPADSIPNIACAEPRRLHFIGR